ncbi:unnamed protein product, partial [Staurois parvus]
MPVIGISLPTSCHTDRGEESRGEITDDQCALMICVAPAAPPVSVHQCQHSSMLPAMPISATSMPHISAHLSCLSVSPIS